MEKHALPKCTMTWCPHVRNLAGHCQVTGCENSRSACPMHGK